MKEVERERAIASLKAELAALVEKNRRNWKENDWGAIVWKGKQADLDFYERQKQEIQRHLDAYSNAPSSD